MLRPIHDVVVIVRDDTEEETPGGIIIPDTAQKKVTRGRVLAVGPGAGQPSKLADRLEHAFASWAGAVNRAGADERLVRECRDITAALRRKSSTLKVGDHVLFGKYTGNEVTVKDPQGVEQDCIVTKDEEVYGVIEV